MAPALPVATMGFRHVPVTERLYLKYLPFAREIGGKPLRSVVADDGGAPHIRVIVAQADGSNVRPLKQARKG